MEQCPRETNFLWERLFQLIKYKTMTREEAKELLPIIQAFAEGKTIQYYDSLMDIADLEDCENPDFENLTYQFRIKPEPTYRTFKDAE